MIEPTTLAPIAESRRLASPCRTPQALAWQAGHFWLSSRDLGSLYRVEPERWEVLEEIKPPGVVWAAVSLGDEMRFTVGEGASDDRFVYRYRPQEGFEKLFACPDFTGSYLSFDGNSLYLSQWYKQRILQLDAEGQLVAEIAVGAEICGHVFARGTLYVLRGVEHPDESWRLARVELAGKTPVVTDLATVPFACRSLAFDGERFWTNHRAADEVVAFTWPQ